MSKELLGSLALSALITIGIIKWQTNSSTASSPPKKNDWVEPEDELEEEVENLSYELFLQKYSLPDNEDSHRKYNFIKKPESIDTNSSIEQQIGLKFDKIQKFKDAEKYDELSDYLDEKIKEAVDNPKLKHIKVNDLRKVKNKILYLD